MDAIQALASQRKTAIASARGIIEKAKADNGRGMNEDEVRSFDAFMSEADRLLGQIDREQRSRGIASRETADTPHEVERRRVATEITRRGGAGVERDGTLFGVELRGLVGSSGAGSAISPDDYSANFFDRLAAESVGLASGFRQITTDRDSLIVPRIDSDAAAAWVAEAGTISPTDAGFTGLTAIPRKIAVLNQISNELIEDSNPDALELLQYQLTRSIALKADLGFYEGSGTAPEIRGLKNVTGIQSVSMGVNGAAFTNLDPFADAIGALEIENSKASAIVLHPRSWKALMKLKADGTSNKALLQDFSGSGAEGVQRRIYGVPVYLSSQLSITEVQGTSGAVASSAYVYQADQVVVVRRRNVTVAVDGSRLFNTDQSEVRAIARLDLVVPNAKAVCRIAGIL